MSTFHFHIDCYGNLITGCCAGLAPVDMTEPHRDITQAQAPIFHTLCKQGPYALMQHARDRHGFQEDTEGYASPCDLCFQVRRHLNATGEYPELRPDGFYR